MTTNTRKPRDTTAAVAYLLQEHVLARSVPSAAEHFSILWAWASVSASLIADHQAGHTLPPRTLETLADFGHDMLDGYVTLEFTAPPAPDDDTPPPPPTDGRRNAGNRYAVTP